MKIGIKYCGGCNNRYDRAAFVNKLRNVVEGMEYVQPEEVYDYLLVVCGCPSCCASIDNIAVKGSIIYIKSAEDFDDVYNKLTGLQA
ncbi:hypothetical protein SH2C18_09460 [Clostridium sediminicola]|uniref:hypothetical protein n=1 Tax=Clostridium sediminicola TaxID=3114879 RepID=UPI0031F2111D